MYAVLTANQDKLNKEDFFMLTARTRKIFEEIGWMEQWRQKATLEGRLEGRREGKLEGRREGKLEGKLEDARAMFQEGISLTKIARITRIPLKRLKKELQAQ
jgi:predicted transposase/invertase (TIGR01784 family)